MKARFFIILLVVLHTYPCLAQTSKGRFIISGNGFLEFSSTKTDINSGISNNGIQFTGPKTIQLDFTPSLGYFVFDNFYVGLAIPFSFFNEEDPTRFVRKTKDWDISIGPQLGYFFGKKKFKPSVRGVIGYGGGKSKMRSDYILSPHSNDNTEKVDYETKYAVLNYEIGGGAAYFFNHVGAIDLFVGYKGVELFERDSDLHSVDRGLSVKIGFLLLL